MTSSRLPLRLSPAPIRVLRRRVLSSPLVADLGRHGWAPFGYALVLVLALLLGLLSGGIYVDWSGIHEIPTTVEAP